MNIGVLTICTGKYVVFFEELYKSCEKFFMPGHKKTYYVYTDGDIPEHENIKKIDQPVLGWPFDSMLRFKMFLNNKHELLNEDYLFFFNANMKCVDYVNEEILPGKENSYLTGVQHPGFANKHPDEFSYERNPNSNFYIPYNYGKYYYQGNFNGGRSTEFIEMSEVLDLLIEDDLSKGIIPIWHDESALNWYLLDKNPLMKSTQYTAPEGWGIEGAKIMARHKGEYSKIRTYFTYKNI